MDGVTTNEVGSSRATVWPEERPANLSELLRFLENLGNQADRYWFRGECEAHPARIPMLLRDADSRSHAEMVARERKLIEAFWKVARRQIGALVPHIRTELTTIHEILEVMPLARHYGIPTRLMDWTTQWFVAAFVAVMDKPEEDGYVYVFNASALEQAVNVRWEALGIGLCPYGSGQRAWIEELRESEPKPFLVQWHYPHRLQRMESQGAKFLLHSRANLAHDESIFQLLEGATDPFKHVRIQICAALKDELLEYLSRFGINADQLGFTALDALCREIARE